MKTPAPGASPRARRWRMRSRPRWRARSPARRGRRSSSARSPDTAWWWWFRIWTAPSKSPTGGPARYVSPLGVYDFVKRISVIGYAERQLAEDAAHIIALAEAEGLFGHAEAVRIRMSDV